MFIVCAVDHPTSAAYPEEFLASARTVALLRQENWNTITRERIRRSIDRISRSKYSSLSIIFFSLFLLSDRDLFQKIINEGRKMMPPPNLSELIRAELNLPRADPPRRVWEPVDESASPDLLMERSPVRVRGSPTEDPAAEVRQADEVSEDVAATTPDPSKKKGKKRSHNESSAKGDQEEASGDRPDTEGPPKRKRRREQKPVRNRFSRKRPDLGKARIRLLNQRRKLRMLLPRLCSN